MTNNMPATQLRAMGDELKIMGTPHEENLKEEEVIPACENKSNDVNVASLGAEESLVTDAIAVTEKPGVNNVSVESPDDQSSVCPIVTNH